MKFVKLLSLFLLLALISFGVVSYLQSEEKYLSSEIADEDNRVFPNLAIDRIEKIVLTNRHGVLTIKKDGNSWFIEEKDHYPADNSRINTLLGILANLTSIQKVPLTEEHWANMGLQDPAKSSEKGTGERIDLFGEKGYHAAIIAGLLQPSNSEASIVFGNDYDGRHFFRQLDEDQVYLANQSLSFLNTIPVNWIKNPMSFPNRYQRISFFDKGKLVWKVSRENRDAPYLLSGPNQQQGITVPNLSVDIEAAFSGILIHDIKPNGFSPEDVNIQEGRYIKLEGQNGDVLKMSLGKKTALSEQERLMKQQQTGFFRSTVSPTRHYVKIAWPNGRKEPPLSEPPFSNKIYQIGSMTLDDYLINYDEMLIFERLKPQIKK